MFKKIFPFLIVLALATSANGQDTVFLDLDKSLQRAEANNRLLKIMQYKIANAEAGLTEMKSNFYPRVVANGNFGYNSDPNIHLKKGELNGLYKQLIDIEWIDEFLEENFPLPPKDLELIKGDNFFYKTNINLYQPISQLSRINTGKKVALTDVVISRQQKQKALSEIQLGVKELYYGILLEAKYEEAAKAALEYKIAEHQDAKNAVQEGEILEVEVQALNAEISQKQQELLEVQNRKEGFILKFKQLLDLDYGSIPVLNPEFNFELQNKTVQDYTRATIESNHQLKIADLTLQKANLGVVASKKEYIPDLTFFAQYNYNKGIPLYPSSYFLGGLNLEWVIFASGQRSSKIKQSQCLVNEASENFLYQKRGIQNKVESLYLDLVYAQKLMATAGKASKARAEQLRLTEDAVNQGQLLNSKLMEAKADYCKVEADLLAAKLNYLIITAKLKQVSGK
jgi:outer membrane protein